MRSVMAFAAVLVVAVAAVATAPAATQSGIRGVVIKGPITPVCRAGTPCSAPAAGVVLLVVRNGATVARATTARDGSFRVVLPPGSYLIRLTKASVPGGMAPRAVRVRAGRFELVKLMIDTGIR
jgi:hypothetical protein